MAAIVQQPANSSGERRKYRDCRHVWIHVARAFEVEYNVQKLYSCHTTSKGAGQPPMSGSTLHLTLSRRSQPLPLQAEQAIPIEINFTLALQTEEFQQSVAAFCLYIQAFKASAGPTLQKDLTQLGNSVFDSAAALLDCVRGKATPHLKQHVGAVFHSCDAVKRAPLENVPCLLKHMTQVGGSCGPTQQRSAAQRSTPRDLHLSTASTNHYFFTPFVRRHNFQPPAPC